MLLFLKEFIGRLHPVLVHLPIGILLTGLFLQILSGKRKYRISPEVIKIILLTGMCSAILSCITGYMLSLTGAYDDKIVFWHMWMGISVAVASLLLLVRVMQGRLDLWHKLASFSLLALIVITGHLGGSLTHGADYLTSVSSSDEETVVKQKKIENVQDAKVYADIVQPILESKCYSCHGTHKQKGGLRMDDQASIMKGGKDGEILVPGNSNESELMKRLVLPPERDHHMPPKGKAQLTDQQIALIHWWVDGGADFYKKVKEIKQEESIKPALLALQNASHEHKAINIIPVMPVEAADFKTINLLKNKGIEVMPVAENSNYLTANFVMLPGATDKDMELLLPIKKQLVWLKAGNTKITDKALQIISKFKSLTQLDLSNTGITDNGLENMKSLDSIQSINLTGTHVSANGLLGLNKLSKLQTLYVFNTMVKTDEWPKIHSALPKTIIDTGGYSIPFVATDTIIVKSAPKAK